MEKPDIVLKKVRVHNLKNVDLTLRPNELVVFTGVSGSGKSSLAFDTIYVEGQRRYVESLSHQVRRSLGDLPKPDAEKITGIAPTIAIEQKTSGKTPRSTVGTMTGLYDFIRVLFAKIGIPHCPVSGEALSLQSREKIIQEILSYSQEETLVFLAPYAKGQKGEFTEDLQDLMAKGFTRLRIDGSWVDISENIQLDGKVAHDIDIVVDRASVADPSRVKEAITSALELGKGFFALYRSDLKEEILFSEFAYAKKSNLSYGPLKPHDFSFNHPEGMCPECQGLGISSVFDPDKIIDPSKSLATDCCLIASSYKTVRYGNIYNHIAKTYHFKIETPWNQIPEEAKHAFLYGFAQKWTRIFFTHPETKKRWHEYVQWKGVLFEAKERLIAAKSDLYRKKMQSLMKEGLCSLCQGSRIKPYPAATKLGGKKIHEITAFTLDEALTFFQTLVLNPQETLIAEELKKEILEKLQFLIQVGLEYLSLDRTSPTLSGGESQRVRLSSQIGAGLTGAIYVLDEPSIGLHARDHHRLVKTLLHLRDLGNTVLVVEHDRDTIFAADTIVDVGPLAGQQGGEILSCGKVEELMENPRSLTGAYLSQKKIIATQKRRKVSKKKSITIRGASLHNLKNIDVSIPLNGLICVTGASGSGKSSLITETIYPALANHFHNAELPVGPHKSIEGTELIDKIIAVDQSPIGRTPRSNAATYIKLFDEIRDLFTNLPESKMRGFQAGHFSFNVKEGSCPYCEGLGQVRVDMDFMEDAWVECPQCKGNRFEGEILAVRYKGKNISDVLNMDVENALLLFENIPSIRKKLELLSRVGLNYLPLGQPSTTLSGGEAQRIKLAKELARPQTGQTLYILDEPTTGLHFHDIQRLLLVLESLVEKGNTVLVIEHNLDFIRTCDWIIDIGPGAGKHGGKLIGEGPPEKIATLNTPTGLALQEPFSIPSQKPKEAIAQGTIRIDHACQNNLKDISLSIPKGAITVFTGPSGSGKSSLAFETLYAEGQRRYTETLSNYAKTLVKPLPKPKVDRIEGLPPSIALEQKTGGLNPRSTVGTLTELYDFLRVLYAIEGTAFDPDTQEEIKAISKEYVVDKLLQTHASEKIHVLAPLALNKGQSLEEILPSLNQEGFLRIRLNQTYFEIDQPIPFEPTKKNDLYLVIDRFPIDPKNRMRFLEAIEKAIERSGRIFLIATEKQDLYFNLAFAVESTGKSYPPITPQTFSFNHDAGMCLECQGLGLTYGAHLSEDPHILKLSLLDIVDRLWKDKATSEALSLCKKLFDEYEIDSETPLKLLSKEALDLILQGGPETQLRLSRHTKISLRWIGLETVLSHVSRMAVSEIKKDILPLLKASPCASCQGSRLNPLARNVRIQGTSLPEFCEWSIEKAHDWISSLSLKKEEILQETLDKMKKSLSFLKEIGLAYLSLNRSAPTLSGGELQRVHLARQLGSGLTSCLYVLDEPTLGLHPANNEKLNAALLHLRNLNNTLVLVEHDPMTLQIADYVVDFGPKAGKEGGKITAQGTLKEIEQNPNSLTGAYLSQRKKIPMPKKRRPFSPDIRIKNASLHNLKNISLSLPKGAITCFTGVSGSGKSSLVRYLLKPAAERFLQKRAKKGPFSYEGASFEGLEAFDKVISIDQSPIGQTARADVSTYSDLQPLIRQLLAQMPLAAMKGLSPAHFSPNHLRGMCRTCWGLGYKLVDLQFLPAVRMQCEACHGNRLNPLSLEVRYKGKHLGDILKMTLKEAEIHFHAIPKIMRKLSLLDSVGLSYLQLGQEISSLSGGEAGRLRLSSELAKRETGSTLYLIDEPSVGLHSEDIAKLIPIFHRLADKKNTLILIEHNLDIIRNADYLIDLGPDAGIHGGEIVAEGTPEEVAKNPRSKTGTYLKPLLKQT